MTSLQVAIGLLAADVAGWSIFLGAAYRVDREEGTAMARRGLWMVILIGWIWPAALLAAGLETVLERARVRKAQRRGPP